ncbi:MAG TPA: mechanosensitive ion channel [Burkholderiaceae bacterium]|nr:mechanosensitive ion channel [Burkholderiaceae bacterium]
MTADGPWAELIDLLQGLVSLATLRQLGVLAGCLLLAWAVSWQLKRSLAAGSGTVMFGRRIFDGVLFPVLALVLALVARGLFETPAKAALFRIAIPALLSLATIRLTARVLHVALPNSRWVAVVERTVSWVAWVAVLLWVTGVLPPLLESLESVTWRMGGAQISLRNVLEGGLSAAVVLVLTLWLSAAIERRLLRGTATSLSTRKIVANLVRVVLLVVGLLVALSVVGIPLTALSVLGGAIGVGIGFGLQKIAANYVSGFVILAERSVRIGDFVTVDTFEGQITDIRTRYTVIRALNGREALVPNEMLITQRVENVTLTDRKVLLTGPLQVAYGTDLEALLPRLEAVMAGVPRVLSEPAPAVLLAGFGADGLNLTINFWIGDPENGQGAVRSEVHRRILTTLDELEVQIPFPQRVVRHIAEGGSTAGVD